MFLGLKLLKKQIDNFRLLFVVFWFCRKDGWVYVFIMVRSILNFVFVVSAWGLLAGMMVASPCFSLMVLPDMVISASPSRI